MNLVSLKRPVCIEGLFLSVCVLCVQRALCRFENMTLPSSAKGADLHWRSGSNVVTWAQLTGVSLEVHLSFRVLFFICFHDSTVKMWLLRAVRIQFQRRMLKESLQVWVSTLVCFFKQIRNARQRQKPERREHFAFIFVLCFSLLLMYSQSNFLSSCRKANINFHKVQTNLPYFCRP